MKIRLAIAAAAVAALSAGVGQAGPVSANANASATIVAPNQVQTIRDLEFGSIARPTSGSSTVTVASAATNTATPTVTGNAFVPTAGQARAATFRLIGTNGQTYSITNNTLSFTTAGLQSVAAETPVAASGTLNTLPNTGQDDLYIGGRFTIDNTTAFQTYTGTLSLTVNFN